VVEAALLILEQNFATEKRKSIRGLRLFQIFEICNRRPPLDAIPPNEHFVRCREMIAVTDKKTKESERPLTFRGSHFPTQKSVPSLFRDGQARERSVS
jgi:hypothetical protein